MIHVLLISPIVETRNSLSALVQVLYLGHGQQSWCWSSNAMSAMSAMSIYSRCKCPDSAWVNIHFFFVGSNSNISPKHGPGFCC